MQVVRIKHPSEKEANPVKEVLFYKKPKTHRELPSVLPKDTAQRKVIKLKVGSFLLVIIVHNNKLIISLQQHNHCRFRWWLYPKLLLSMN